MQISFIRRLDELGRIVIPKEIRNKLNFNYGDLLDLNIKNEVLIIKKSMIVFNLEYVNNVISLLEYLTPCDIVITDKDKVIAKSKRLNNINLESIISDELKSLINEHKSSMFDSLKISDNIHLNGGVYVKSLIKDSNVLGLFIIKLNQNLEEISILLNIIEKLLLK